MAVSSMDYLSLCIEHGPLNGSTGVEEDIIDEDIFGETDSH
jgi:hypothetical protein